MFKVGDIVKGKRNNGYGITNHEMTKARVISVEDDSMEIEVLDHKDRYRVGQKYPVSNTNKWFELLECGMGFIVTAI